jgi:hypothetical protein
VRIEHHAAGAARVFALKKVRREAFGEDWAAGTPSQ